MFRNCTSLEQLKGQYYRKMMENHPDRGGSTEQAQKINLMYEKYFEKLKNIHTNMKGEKYEKETTETPENFKDIIEKLMKMENIEIEVVGKYVWVFGNTKPYKEELKGMGFSWCQKYLKWYFTPDGYTKKHWKSKYKKFEQLEETFGATKYKAKGQKKLATI